VLAASIIMAIMALMMEAASTSETSANFYHGATTQKTVIFKMMLK
jgi:hypothetical protein